MAPPTPLPRNILPQIPETRLLHAAFGLVFFSRPPVLPIRPGMPKKRKPEAPVATTPPPKRRQTETPDTMDVVVPPVAASKAKALPLPVATAEEDRVADVLFKGRARRLFPTMAGLGSFGDALIQFLRNGVGQRDIQRLEYAKKPGPFTAIPPAELLDQRLRRALDRTKNTGEADNVHIAALVNEPVVEEVQHINTWHLLCLRIAKHALRLFVRTEDGHAVATPAPTPSPAKKRYVGDDDDDVPVSTPPPPPPPPRPVKTERSHERVAKLMAR